MAEKARFVSRYGKYSVGVSPAVKEHLGHDGEMVPRKRRVDAQFHVSLVTDEDFALALQSFNFPGLPFDEDTNSHVSPRFRVSAWDSESARLNEGLTDDEVARIIEKLRATAGPDHFEIPAKKAGEPIPNYDDLPVEDILTIVKLAGIDPEAVAAYESENQNRSELLDILQGVTAGDSDAVVVSA